MTRLLTYNGHTNTIAGWAATNGITPSAIYERLKNGWTVEEACANTRVDRFARKAKTPAKATTSNATTLRLDELKRMDLMLQREVTRTLRQFCRDLEAIMSRGWCETFQNGLLTGQFPPCVFVGK